jgi:signal peptidase I
MQPTLRRGDVVVVDRGAYRDRNPGRGDIVAYYSPRTTRRVLIHRIVACPGETVRIEDGSVEVDGSPLVAPWMRGLEYVRIGQYGVKPVEVPPGHVFVLGDHSSMALDSRFCGCLNTDRIIGRAVGIAWPLGRWQKFN